MPRATLLAAGLSLLLVLIACIRIISTHKVFSHTSDEPAHIACGLEWWTAGTFGSEVQHPPLARAAAAAGPYFQGIRWSGNSEFWGEGARILYGRDYLNTLSAARSGILLFFVLACVIVWLWTAELYGVWGALCAVFLLTNTPPVLAHAGLATTDMAAAAGVITAAYTMHRYLTSPSVGRAVVAGLGIGLAVMSKFSAVPFLAVSLIPLLLLHLRQLKASHIRNAAVVALVVILCVAAAYRFSFRPTPSDPGRAGAWLTNLFGPGETVTNIANRLTTAPAVISGPILGIIEVANHGKIGHGSYLLGQYAIYGWWYFFPVALLIKTPIPLLALVITGIVGLIMQRKLFTSDGLPLWIAAAVLTVCVRSPIGLGVRHALPVYPLMAIIGASAAVFLWQFRSKAVHTCVIAALFWTGAESALAHPDYLAYFNQFARSSPERFLVDSDLDWGQDVLRLSEWAGKHGIAEISIAVFTNADLTQHGFKRVHALRPYERATGWVARSLTFAKLRSVEWAQPGQSGGAFDWLNAYQPVARIGKSIDVYYVK